MTTTTPIHGWPIPEDTDPVEQGAAAMRALGNAIDAHIGYTVVRRANPTAQITTTEIVLPFDTFDPPTAPYPAAGTGAAGGITVTKAGLYLVTTQVNWSPAAASRMSQGIGISGANKTWQTLQSVTTGNTHSLQTSGVIAAAAGQRIEVLVTAYGANTPIASASLQVIGPL